MSIDFTFDKIKDQNDLVTVDSLYNFVSQCGVILTKEEITTIINNKFHSDHFDKQQFITLINDNTNLGMPDDVSVSNTFKIASKGHDTLGNNNEFDVYYNFVAPGKLDAIKTKMSDLAGVDYSEITEELFKSILEQILNT